MNAGTAGTAPHRIKITGRVLAAGRALAGVGIDYLAKAGGISPDRLACLEAAGSAWIDDEAEAEAVRRGLDHYGVVIVEEGDGMGAGVRLKFTRSDVRQITRLEGEGGMVGSDDAP